MANINGNDLANNLVGTNLVDTINGLGGNDTISGLAANDTLDGGAGNDLIVGGLGADSMTGGADNDTFFIDNLGDEVIENVDGGIDEVRITLANASVTASVVTLGESGPLGFLNVENVQILGTGLYDIVGSNSANRLVGNGSVNVIDGFDGNDSLEGGAGNDTLNGGAANDTLVGGLGIDSLVGGAGDDLYRIDATDLLSELADEGNDTVETAFTVNLGDTKYANIENATLVGVGAGNLTGTAVANVLTGNGGNNIIASGDGDDTLIGAAGNDSLVGGIGADSMDGGAGNDTYVVDSADDTVFESLAGAAGGVDTVVSSVDFTLGANLENLTFDSASARTGTGNILANRIIGDDGGDTLSGLGGNDVLVGNGGDDSLDGGDGIDNMTGGLGDDTYVVGTVGDAVSELPGAGRDEVRSAITYSLGDNVEDLVLTGSGNINGTGNALANEITGNGGNNLINGGLLDDTLSGGAGRDTLIGGDGNDLLSGGTENDSLVGGAGNDSILGGAGIDILEGGTGNNTLAGGENGDFYGLTSASDVVQENELDSGQDIVIVRYNNASSTPLTIDLATQYQNTEVLSLQGLGRFNVLGTSGSNAIDGNASANVIDGLEGDDVITGGAGNDTLIGGGGDDYLQGDAGADSMDGGAGHDTYVIDSVLDVIADDTSGIDQVEAFISYSIAARSDLEDILLLGSAATSATGNALDNLIAGNLAANRLDGGTGADAMVGGGGNDTYIVDDVGDRALENLILSGADVLGNGVGGIDLVLSSVTFALAESQVLGGLVSGVENLTLTGSSNINGTGNQLNNIITGNTGNNTLAGNAGNDVLLGNAGDDILQGGIGNDNLQGGAGNDSLDGGTGNDVMNGLGGNDTYVVDSATDQVVESLAGAAGGTDTVLASVSHALDLNVENLTLTGGNNINGTGNSTANTITGNTGNNVLLGGVGLDVLSGGDGNDTLNGGANNDNLTGGLGDDVFVFSTAAGALNNDVVTDFTTGSDKLHFENAIFTAIGVAGAFAATKFFSIAQAGDYTGTSAGMDAADRLVYNTDTGKLYYDANGSVAGGHVLVATLFDGTETPAALSATDIVVI